MKTYWVVLTCLITAISSSAQTNVRVSGAMKNVMWKGQLYGTIALDTIPNKNHLYGLGPCENLAGEIMVVDGKSYRSKVVSGTEMEVTETFAVKAPFFVYANVTSWQPHDLPKTVTDQVSLEKYLQTLASNREQPFVFKLVGSIVKANIHIVNLPEGKTVASPDDAHTGQVNYGLGSEDVTIVGFYSTEHQAIFTHHDTFIHMHLITAEHLKMGHVEQVQFAGNMKLYLSQ